MLLAQRFALVFAVLRRQATVVNCYCFLPLFLGRKGAKSIVYLTYIYRISIVFDSGLSATLLLFDS